MVGPVCRADGQALLKDVEERREGRRRSGGAVLAYGSLAGIGFAAFGATRFSLRACVKVVSTR